MPNTSRQYTLPIAHISPFLRPRGPGFSLAGGFIPLVLYRQFDSALTLSDAPLRDDAGFVVSFQSPAFTGPVLVLATRPLSAGVTQPSPKDFRQIALFPSFTASLYDLSGPYASQFPDPAVGMKIVIQFVPVTPTGFRGNPFTQIITVTL